MNFTSSYSYYEFEYNPEATAWQLCIVVLEVAFIIIGLLGNSLLIFIIVANANMHCAHNYLLVCLAIGDLLLLTLGVPIFVLKKLATYADFLHKTTIGCKLVHGCLVMAECVSIGTFTALSVDRYLVIRYRMTSGSSQSYRKYICICMFIWISAMLISAPIFHQAHIKEIEIFANVSVFLSCFPFHMHSSFARTYEAMISIVIYIIPLILILICYSKMAFILMTSIRTNNVISQGSATDAMERRRYLARSVLVMIVIFAVCWLPMHATELVRQFHEEDDDALFDNTWLDTFKNLKYLMIIFSACANPLVLFSVSKQFQRYLNQYFCCKKYVDIKQAKSFTLVPSYKKLIEKDATRSTAL